MIWGEGAAAPRPFPWLSAFVIIIIIIIVILMGTSRRVGHYGFF